MYLFIAVFRQLIAPLFAKSENAQSGRLTRPERQKQCSLRTYCGLIWLLPKFTRAVPASLTAILVVTSISVFLNSTLDTKLAVQNKKHVVVTVRDMLFTNATAQAVAKSESTLTPAEKYVQNGKRLHLTHLSLECRALLNRAGDLVEVNLSEDPQYHVATDRIIKKVPGSAAITPTHCRNSRDGG